MSRDPSRATLAARGTAFLSVAALLVGALLLVGRGSFAATWSATARVDDAGGSLVPGSDVKYDGVVVGEVAGLETASDGVELDLELEPGLADDVPRDVRVRVLPASVFGISYVDLVRQDGSPSGTLRSGAVLEQDLSAKTLEIQDLLDGLDEVVDALGPADLATTLEALATALDGNGERLGETLETLHRYLAKLNPSMPLVGRNLALLSTNLEAFQRYAPGLLDATDDALVAAQTLAEEEAGFAGLVRSGSRTLDSTADLVIANREALVGSILRTAVLIDVLYDGRTDLVDGLLATTDLARGFREALTHGHYLRIDANLVLAEEPEYTREACPTFGSRRGRGC
jgi:virulence factor Mce-like protein